MQRLDINAAFQQLHNLRASRQQEQAVPVPSTSTATGGEATGQNDQGSDDKQQQQKDVGKSSSSSGAGSGLTAEEVADSTLCLVLATDGVWDNWLYEDVNKFVMDASCLGAVGAAADGAKRVTISFMQRNALYAKRNFGSNADNATGIVLYISQDPRMPSL